MKNLTITQLTVLDLLHRSIFNDYNTTSCYDEVDWEDVFIEAKDHVIAALVYDGTIGIENIPKEVIRLFKQETISSMINNDLVECSEKKIIDVFKKNEIQCAILKGSSVGRYYPNPNLRVLGDIDILVNFEDRFKAQKVMLRNNYVCLNNLNKDISHFHTNWLDGNVSIELHHRITEFGNTNSEKQLKDFMRCAVEKLEKEDEKYLSFIYQCISLLVHIRQHMRLSGLGLRQLVDWCMFVNKKHLEFTNHNINILKTFNLDKLAIFLTKTCQIYLGLPKNCCEFCGKVNKSYCEQMILMFFNSGNLGRKDYFGNKTNHILYRTHGNNCTLNKAIKYLVTRSCESWPIVNKIPILKIFAPIYLPIRYIFRMIFGQRKHVNMFKFYCDTVERDNLFRELNL